jgi:cobalt/nickel transport system permease protein
MQLNMSRSFVERNLSRFTTLLQDTVFAEQTASRKGLLQGIDPRAKIATFLLLILSSSFSHSLLVIFSIYLLGIILAWASDLFSIRFIRRIWLFMPFYTFLIAVPALFLTPGDPLLTVLDHAAITKQGTHSAIFLILRVATSVSFMLMLVLTTSWPRLLKALRHLGVPRSIVFLLTMTYRYIYVLLHTANSFFLARKSRQVGQENWQSTRDWFGTFMGSLLGKSYQLSNEVYLAMQSRGFRGEPMILSDLKWKFSDTAWSMFLFLFAGACLYLGYWKHL